VKRQLVVLAPFALAACHVLAGIDAGDPECQVDQTRNGLETDVDCGGPCAPCGDNQRCLRHEDCINNACFDEEYCAPGECGDEARDYFCYPPDCDDDRLNGTESDVDCGGEDCERCYGTQGCDEDWDCAAAAQLPEGEHACVDGSCISTCCFDDCELCGCDNPDEPDPECCPPTCGEGLLGDVCTDEVVECNEPLQCFDEVSAESRCY